MTATASHATETEGRKTRSFGGIVTAIVRILIGRNGFLKFW